MEMQALSRNVVRHDTTDSAPKRAGAPVDPGWVLAMVRRGWRTLAMAALGGLVVGGIVAMFVVPTEWESEAVLVADAETDPANPWATQDTLSEGAQLIEHPTTLAGVRQRLGLTGTVDALDRRIDAEADREAGVIRVTARSTSASGAAALTEAVVDTFLAQRRVSEGDRLS
ncbi:MAG: hypothetical protein M3Y87_25555, partial [Myxococcota bacterium]|nr:hypothetical protein [Myxococcota bacterium]